MHVVAPGHELDFLHPLPVGDLWGVGPATLAKLERLGIATVGDLAATPYPALASSLGKGAATHLHELAHGRDDRAVVPDQAPKSISHEETFAVDLTSLEQLRPEVVRMSDAVAARLRHHGFRGRTVQVKVRYRDFTHDHPVDDPAGGDRSWDRGAGHGVGDARASARGPRRAPGRRRCVEPGHARWRRSS